MMIRKDNEQLKHEVRALKEKISSLTQELDAISRRPATSNHSGVNVEVSVLRDKERELRGMLVEKDSQISK